MYQPNSTQAMTASAARFFDELEFIKRDIHELRELLERMEGQRNGQTWWTTEQLAELLDVSPFTIRTHWIGKGRLPARKTESGRWLIHNDDVQRLKAGEPLDPPTC